MSRTWIIDALDGEIARIEEDGERTITVPRWLLPAAAREGSVLRVVRDPEGRGRTTIAIAVDAAETGAAAERSRAQVAALEAASRKRDRGGDVEL